MERGEGPSAPQEGQECEWARKDKEHRKRFLRQAAQAHRVFRQEGRELDSIPLFEECLETAQRTSGWRSSFKVLDSMVDLGVALFAAGRPGDGTRRFEEVEELAQGHLRSKKKKKTLLRNLALARKCARFHWLVQEGMAIFREDGREREAADKLQRALDIIKAADANWTKYPDALRCGVQLAEARYHAKQPQEVLELGLELLPLLRRKGLPEGFRIVSTRVRQAAETLEPTSFTVPYMIGMGMYNNDDYPHAMCFLGGALQVLSLSFSRLWLHCF